MSSLIPDRTFQSPASPAARAVLDAWWANLERYREEFVNRGLKWFEQMIEAAQKHPRGCVHDGNLYRTLETRVWRRTVYGEYVELARVDPADPYSPYRPRGLPMSDQDWQALGPCERSSDRLEAAWGWVRNPYPGPDSYANAERDARNHRMAAAWVAELTTRRLEMDAWLISAAQVCRWFPLDRAHDNDRFWRSWFRGDPLQLPDTSSITGRLALTLDALSTLDPEAPR